MVQEVAGFHTQLNGLAFGNSEQPIQTQIDGPGSGTEQVVSARIAQRPVGGNRKRALVVPAACGSTRTQIGLALVAVNVAVAVKVLVGVAVAGFALVATIWRVTLDDPPGPDTVRKTLYVPGVVKTCDGLRSELVEPSLKFQR